MGGERRWSLEFGGGRSKEEVVGGGEECRRRKEVPRSPGPKVHRWGIVISRSSLIPKKIHLVIANIL